MPPGGPSGKPPNAARPASEAKPAGQHATGSADQRSGGVLHLGDEVGLDLGEVAGLGVNAALALATQGELRLGGHERRLLLGADVLGLPATGAEPAAAR